MSAAQLGGRYRSTGEWHEVLVTRDACGRWQVLDATGSEIVVVETLTGHDDRLDQALAVARDYAAEQHAFQDGSRHDAPLPRPVRPRRRRLIARAVALRDLQHPASACLEPEEDGHGTSDRPAHAEIDGGRG